MNNQWYFKLMAFLTGLASLIAIYGGKEVLWVLCIIAHLIAALGAYKK